MPDRSSPPLQPSDARVFEAASRFFAALLGGGRVNETNQPGILRYCIRAAMQLAQETDRAIVAERQPAAQSAPDELDLDMELEELAKGDGTAYRSRPPQGPAGGRQGAPPSV